MGETKIAWTHFPRADGSFTPGYTFNAWVGCCKVDTECARCYAETFAATRMHLPVWGPTAARHAISAKTWQAPRNWNKAAAALGERHAVFCSSLADVFEGPETCRDPDAWRVVEDGRARLWPLIEETPNLVWHLLTKRPENIDRFVPATWLQAGGWPQNVWLGTTAGTQKGADDRIPKLLAVRASHVPVFFVSAEPLLEYVDFRPWMGYGNYAGNVPCVCVDIDGMCHHGDTAKCRTCGWGYPDDPDYPGRVRGIDWMIIGGESGPKSRICRIEHLDGVAYDCRQTGVPVFVKQIGDRPAMDFYSDDDYLREWSGLEDGDDTHCRILNPVRGRPGDYVEWSERDGQPMSGALWQIHGRVGGRKGGDINRFPASLQLREFPQIVDTFCAASASGTIGLVAK